MERQRRSFTEEYKLQAVGLVLSSGRSITSVGKELGHSKATSLGAPNSRISTSMRIPRQPA
jgi:transposase-like protein